MGSFYVTCSLSGMTITDGQPCAIQLLTPTFQGKRPLTEHKGLWVSNEGPSMFYSPFGFPLEGQYADYGNIDGLQQSDMAVVLLEQYFNLSIDAILEAATDKRWIEYGDEPGDTCWGLREGGGNAGITNREVLESLTCTYYRTEVYDYLKGKSDKVTQQYAEWLLLRPANNFQETEEYKQKLASYIETLTSEGASEEGKKNARTLAAEFLSGHTSWYSKGNDYRKSKWLCYIPQLVDFNMFMKLPLTDEHAVLCMEQQGFIKNLLGLDQLLLPSNYGTQEANFTERLKFGVFVNKLLRANKKEEAAY